jgi:hypothetical protein
MAEGVLTIVDGGSLLSCDPPTGMEIAGGSSMFDALVAAKLAPGDGFILSNGGHMR